MAKTGELASNEWWARQGSTFPSVPPEATLRDVLRDIFDAMSLPQGFAGRSRGQTSNVAPDLGTFSDQWGFSTGLPKAAPASSLAARQGPLHFPSVSLLCKEMIYINGQ